MAHLVLFSLLILALTGHSSANWCVCKDGIGESTLQKTLDYACGAGADCNPLHQGGVCFQPNTVKAHCSYAVNSYFQKKGQAAGSCDFSGTASVSTSDPSYTGCAYPASASSSGNTTPATTTPSTTTPPSSTTPSTYTPSTTVPSTSSTPTTTSPYSTTPSNGILGGVGTGLGPSGAGMNTDISDGGLMVRTPIVLYFCATFVFAGLIV